MTEALLLEALRFGFVAIAAARRQGMTNAEINSRLDRVDNGDEPITLDEVKAINVQWGDELAKGRAIP